MPTNLAEGYQGFSSNAFLVPGDRPVVVDPGNEFDVVSEIERRGERPEAVVLTHTHPDHVGNVEAVVEAFGVDVWGFDPDHPLVDHEIEDGDRVRLGDHDYRALHTPGHKDDHLCFHAPDPAVLYSGDLVFANGGFGRTDLEEGDRPTLVESIGYVLETVDDSLAAMHPGHGPSMTRNPYRHVLQAERAAKA